MPRYGYAPVTVLVGDEATLPIANELRALARANASAVEGAPQTLVSRVQKRRPFEIITSRRQSPRSIQTTSHLNVDSMSDSEDKKRNKLGYQRISIACAHCRRRKIRCLLAEGDSQERCQNCIRLKKECVFYPVDQQQVLENRSQSGAQSGPGSVPSAAVSPSPPELASGRPFERSRQYGSFPSLPSLPSNAPPRYGAQLPSGATLQSQGEFIPAYPTHGIPSHDSVGPSPTEYAFQQTPTEGQRHWEQVNNLSSPSAPVNRARDSMQPQYWRSSPNGPSADFAPFPNSASTAPQVPLQDGSFSYPVPETQAWHPSQPARSMSFGCQMQDMTPTGYIPSAVGYAPQPAPESQSTGAATHAPALASASGRPAPMGAPIMPFGQQQSPFMFQSQGAVSASPIPTQHPFANHWYGDPSTYGAQEHDLRSPTDNRQFTSKPGQ